MKLLIDQNLAPRLARSLQDLFPGSVHVRELELQFADDRVVWDAAKAGGYVIVSKDADFHQLSFVLGAPPKVIWLRVGNRTAQDILDLIRQSHGRIQTFEADREASFLVLP